MVNSPKMSSERLQNPSNQVVNYQREKRWGKLPLEVPGILPLSFISSIYFIFLLTFLILIFSIYILVWKQFFFFFLVFTSSSFFFLFRVATVAYGRSWIRGRIRAEAAGLHHSSQQRQILNPLSQARDQTLNLMVPSQMFPLCNDGNSKGCYFYKYVF